MQATGKWQFFLKELSNLIFFWIFGILFFIIYRLFFIFIFNDQLGSDTQPGDIMHAISLGLKFDNQVISYFMLLPVVSTLFLLPFVNQQIIRRIRITCQYLFVVLSTIICVITLNYYREYNDQFNSFLFLGLYDDQKAVFMTILKYYNPIMNLCIIIGSLILGIWLLRFFEQKTAIYSVLKRVNFKFSRVLLITLSLLLFVCMMRGSLKRAPATKKWAYQTTDIFLNKTVINPFRSLKYAYNDHKELNSIGDNNPFGDSYIQSILDGHDTPLVSEIIKKQTGGTDSLFQKPKQIFLFILESYDAWPLLDKYKCFNVSKNLSKIAENGTHFTNFLPAYNATFYAYSSIVTGIPYVGIHDGNLAVHKPPYITSIFSQFKKLGYKTNFFYGGFLSWGNIGEFTQHLGCDHIYSAANVAEESDFGDWGVDDESILNYIFQKVDPNQYTFNVVLTTSYHSPYPVKVYEKGFPYRTVEDLPAEAKQYFNNGMSLLELGHLWYGDYALGLFMDEAEKKYPEALYAITGDHYARRFLNASPNLYERSAVPFILYGENIPSQKLKTPGSHIDIMPTLIELVAPEATTYYSFGNNMFGRDKEIGFSFEKLITTDSLSNFPKDAPVLNISLSDNLETIVPSVTHKEEYDNSLQLAWQYIVKGDSIK